MNESVIQCLNVCRICMKSNENMFFIFNTTENNTKTIAEMLTEFTRYAPVDREDKLPKNICEICSKQVQDAYFIKEMAEKSYRQLYKLCCNGDEETTRENKTEIMKIQEKSTQTEIILEVNKQEKSFEDQNNDSMHNTKELSTRVPCPICQRTFSRKDHMKEHIAKFHKEDPKKYATNLREAGLKCPLQCPICQRIFTRKEHLKRHIASVHKQDSVSVLMKSIKESIKSDVEEREMIVLNESVCINENNFADKNPISCDNESEDEKLVPIETDIKSEVCDNSPNVKEENSETMLVKVENSNLDSDEDENSEYGDRDKEFSNTEFQEDDSEMQKNEEKDGIIEGKKRSRRPKGLGEGTPEERTCQLCQHVFSRLCHLRRHMQSQHSENKPYSCSYCKKCFSRSDLFKNHVQAVHGEKTFKCDLCEKAFARKDGLQRHKKTPHGDAARNAIAFECELCQRKFTQKRYLVRHQLVHTDRIHACRFCEETFEDRKLFQEHERGHKTKEKNFLCSICGDSFVRIDYLRIHMRRHLGEKPYKCQYCGKGFPRSSDVKEHERYHTNTKPNVCKICGKAFFRKNKLTIHMRTHTGEKPYKCQHCPKCFAQSNDLKAHERRHTGERFRCEQCDASYLQLYGLRQHVLNAHGTLIKSTTGRLQKINLNEHPVVNLQLSKDPKTVLF